MLDDVRSPAFIRFS